MSDQKDETMDTTEVNQVNEDERKLISLPSRLGGMGIRIPSEISSAQYDNSVAITMQLKKHIVLQKEKLEINN